MSGGTDEMGGGALSNQRNRGVSVDIIDARDRLVRMIPELRSIEMVLETTAKFGRLDEGLWQDGIDCFLARAIGDLIDALAGVLHAIDHPVVEVDQ